MSDDSRESSPRRG